VNTATSAGTDGSPPSGVESAASPSIPSMAPAPTGRARGVLSQAVTVLAGLVVLAVFLVPGPEHATLAAVLRIPVEALLGLGLVLAVPARWRRLVALVVGGALGLWAVLRIVDVGFFAVLSRPFDPVLDWSFLSSGVRVLERSMGSVRATGVVVAAVVAALAVVTLVAVSVRRLGFLASRHRRRSAQALGALSVVWIVCAATGAQVVDGVPVAGRDYLERIGGLGASLRDGAAYQQQLADDAYRDAPADALLTALRGRDVVIVLVESYGRVALEHPRIAPEVTAVLRSGADRLAAAGFAARSGFLTSPTAGGGSWLAYASLLSGTWVDNQRRYQSLADSDRLPLAGAFRRAGWRTVAVMPGVTLGWAEGPWYAFDDIYEFQDLGYAGPLYCFDTMPDQYVLSVFHRIRSARPGPVMAVIPLMSSHAPWTPVPELLDWAEIGDGSVYAAPTEALQPAEIVLQRDAGRVQADYRRAVGYSLSTVLSYVEEYGDDDLVLVFLGDHQPAPVVTGSTDNRDVPISLVTRDPEVMALIADWGWVDGLVPGADAPVWRMDEFRDRFLAAFA
jgi:Phosphoglycerol transferase and related proteins, alkaline phosphatase superfamily